MSIRSYIPSSLTVGFMTLLLVFGLSIVGLGATQKVNATVNSTRTISAPGEISLSAVRGEKDSSSALTVNYSTDHSNDEITVEVTQSPTGGTDIDGSVLNIRGGVLGDTSSDWTELWSSSGSSSAITLKSINNPEESSVSDVEFQLDASNVATGAANLGTTMSFTVTYTIGAA